MKRLLLWTLVLCLKLAPIKALKCFQCTKHQEGTTNPCPTSSDDITAWSKDPNKYQEVGDVSTTRCSLRIAGDNTIFHQGGIALTSCESPSITQQIKDLINKGSGTTGSGFYCCSKDGCNWNIERASKNLDLTESTTSDTSYVVIGLLLAGLICLLLVAAFLVIWTCLGGVCCACGCCAGFGGENKEEPETRDKQLKDGIDGAININDRHRYVRRQEASRAITPIDGYPMERALTGRTPSRHKVETTSRPATVEVDESKDTESEGSSDEPEPKPKEAIVGPKQPKVVAMNKITKSALFHFQND